MYRTHTKYFNSNTKLTVIDALKSLRSERKASSNVLIISLYKYDNINCNTGNWIISPCAYLLCIVANVQHHIQVQGLRSFSTLIFFPIACLHQHICCLATKDVTKSSLCSFNFDSSVQLEKQNVN